MTASPRFAFTVAAAVIVILGIVLQSHAAVTRAAQRVETKRADLAYIQSVLPELRAAPVPQGGGESLVIVVDRTTRDSGLAMSLRGTEPAGQTSVRVRFEGASFETASLAACRRIARSNSAGA